MTRQRIPHLVGAIFVTVGLYCSTINAETEMKEKPQLAFTMNNLLSTMKSPAINIANNYAYPSITSEIFNKYNQSATRSFPQASQQPMLGIKVADFVNLVPRKFDNKNSIFEFAAKFNDKLQQVLAFLDFSSTSIKNKDENISEADQKRTVSIIAKHDKRLLKANCSAIKG